MHIIIALVSSVILICNGQDLAGPVDLSWPYDHTAKVCAGDQDFEFLKKIISNGSVWYSFNTFAVAEHCGTHIDSPYHFDPEGITLEKIPVEKLLVTGITIDVANETGDNENYTMPLTAVKEWENSNGPIPENSVVLVRFGWASKYSNKEEYIRKDNRYRFPGIAPEVAEYFINSKKVVGVGVDAPSVDPAYDSQWPAHRSLNKAGLYILENVAITSPLPPVFKLIVAPMKIAEGTGGPTRLFALPMDYKF